MNDSLQGRLVTHSENPEFGPHRHSPESCHLCKNLRNPRGSKDNECYRCGGEGLKTDEKGKWWCKKCIQRFITVMPRVAESKPGRNQPCPCGSGLKYKKCHGNI